MSNEAFRTAVDRAGNQSAFARAVGTSQQLVSYWIRREKVLPGEFVLKAEAATGVSRHDLRPDLYPRETGPVATPATPVAFHAVSKMKGTDA